MFERLRNWLKNSAQSEELVNDTNISGNGDFWGVVDPKLHWLFLDIDGVLHRAENGTLEFMPSLAFVLEHCPDTGIILSTNWRIGATQGALLKHFPDTIANKIAGQNPDLDGVVPHHVRFHECMAVVRKFNLNRYTFIDDTARLFPPGCPTLFLTERHRGLDTATAGKLIDLINAES